MVKLLVLLIFLVFSQAQSVGQKMNRASNVVQRILGTSFDNPDIVKAAVFMPLGVQKIKQNTLLRMIGGAHSSRNRGTMSRTSVLTFIDDHVADDKTGNRRNEIVRKLNYFLLTSGPDRGPHATQTVFSEQRSSENTGSDLSEMAEVTDYWPGPDKVSRQIEARQMAMQLRSTEAATRRMVWIACWVVIIAVVLAFILWYRDRKAVRLKYQGVVDQLEEEMFHHPGGGPAATQVFSLHLSDKQLLPASTSKAPQKDAAMATAAVIATEELVDTPTVEPRATEVAGGMTSTSIAEHTEARLLTKLARFESSNRFLKQNINLVSVGHYIGTNQTYLSELLKVHRGKTFNSYINGLRIDYITRKLREDPVYREYKIAHLAQQAGFASRQVFLSVFKKFTGVTPSYFIGQLKEGIEDGTNDFSDLGKN